MHIWMLALDFWNPATEMYKDKVCLVTVSFTDCVKTHQKLTIYLTFAHDGWAKTEKPQIKWVCYTWISNIQKMIY